MVFLVSCRSTTKINKIKMAALRRSAEEYGQTTRSGDQLQGTITAAKSTIRNSNKGINDCMEANKGLWNEYVERGCCNL